MLLLVFSPPFTHPFYSATTHRMLITTKEFRNQKLGHIHTLNYPQEHVCIF